MTPDERLALQIEIRSSIKSASEMIGYFESLWDNDYEARKRLEYYRGIRDGLERILGRVVLPGEGLRK